MSTTITILFMAFCLNLLYNYIKAFETRDSEGHEKNVTFADDSGDKNYGNKTIIRTTRKRSEDECICPSDAKEECFKECPHPGRASNKSNRNAKYKLSSSTMQSSEKS